MMLRWNKKYSMILVSMLFVLIIGAIFAFYRFVMPVQNDVKQLKEEIATQNQLIDKVNNNDDAFEEARATVEKLKNQLPDQLAVDRLLLQLKKMEESSNVTLTRITNSEERTLSEDYPKLSTSTFQLEFTADNYDEMNRFLTEIDLHEQLIEINHLEYTMSANGVKAITTITTFYNSVLADV